jgi:hypothetical protein
MPRELKTPHPSALCSVIENCLPKLQAISLTLDTYGNDDHAAMLHEVIAQLLKAVPAQSGSEPDSMDFVGFPGKLAQVSTGTWFRARIATPFQERSPCQTASYPIARRAFTGKAPCSALSSWRLTTSGSALINQAKRLSSRLLMLLILKVAILTSLVCPCTYGWSPVHSPGQRSAAAAPCYPAESALTVR